MGETGRDHPQSGKNAPYIDDTVSVDEGVIREPRPLAPHECPPFARLLELVGRRWTSSILRYILAEPGRFNKMSRDMAINPNTLRVRLVDLENEGLVTRIVESTFPPRVRYELTPRGSELAAILDRLMHWATEAPPREAASGVAEEQAEYQAEQTEALPEA